MTGIKEQRMICCFCGNNVNRTDLIILNIFTNLDHDEAQQLFCHKKCFKIMLHPSIPIHPDLFDI